MRTSTHGSRRFTRVPHRAEPVSRDTRVSEDARIMGRHQHRGSVGSQAHQIVHQGRGASFIEMSGRLIEQKDPRSRDERSRQCHPLSFAAREAAHLPCRRDVSPQRSSSCPARAAASCVGPPVGTSGREARSQSRSSFRATRSPEKHSQLGHGVGLRADGRAGATWVGPRAKLHPRWVATCHRAEPATSSSRCHSLRVPPLAHVGTGRAKAHE